MKKRVDRVDVVAEMDIIRSWTALERARVMTDPRMSPVAVIVEPSGYAGAKLLEVLASSITFVPSGERLTTLCGWGKRAAVVRAATRLDPLEAIRLERAPATEVKRWPVLHAAAVCRVRVHGGARDEAVRVAENEMIGAVYTRCLDTRCSGDDDHDWEQRECVDVETNEWRDDTTCTRCGLPEDLYMSWSAWDGP
jgi:hypothetical protein